MSTMRTVSEFTREFNVRSWLAASTNGNGHVTSCIVNLKASYDKRYNVKYYFWYDYENERYIGERA